MADDMIHFNFITLDLLAGFHSKCFTNTAVNPTVMNRLTLNLYFICRTDVSL